MRLPRVRGYAPFFSTNRTRERAYHVELWEQPLHRWLAARVYHWYDMRVHRLPGYRLLERIKAWRYRNAEPLTYMPISAEQDCRCYDLSRRGRAVHAVFEIDEQTYRRLVPVSDVPVAER
jgi:hypothetical protein